MDYLSWLIHPLIRRANDWVGLVDQMAPFWAYPIQNPLTLLHTYSDP